MRKYIVSPVTGLAVAGMVGGVSAMSAAQGGVYRVGFTNEAGEIPWWGDFRFLGFLGALGFNLLPQAGRIPIAGPFLDQGLGMLSQLPVVGGLLTNESLQDYAALAGGAALISYAATEGVGVRETEQFMGLPMPDFVMEFLGTEALPAPAGDVPPIAIVEDVAPIAIVEDVA